MSELDAWRPRKNRTAHVNKPKQLCLEAQTHRLRCGTLVPLSCGPSTSESGFECLDSPALFHRASVGNDPQRSGNDREQTPDSFGEGPKHLLFAFIPTEPIGLAQPFRK